MTSKSTVIPIYIFPILYFRKKKSPENTPLPPYISNDKRVAPRIGFPLGRHGCRLQIVHRVDNNNQLIRQDKFQLIWWGFGGESRLIRPGIPLAVEFPAKNFSHIHQRRPLSRIFSRVSKSSPAEYENYYP